MEPPPLYNPKTIQKKFAELPISKEQKQIALDWIKKLKENKLEKEVENYLIFRDEILRDLLGYPEKKIKFAKEFVEFSVKDEKDKTVVCIECKGTKTKDLFARQHYGKKEQETPFVQTYTDMGRFPGILYGVCTNYKDFVLLDAKHGTTKCHKFDFLTGKDLQEKLKEFVGIFSYENLVSKKTLNKLYENSVMEEKKLTKQFYDIFRETREMLIQAFTEKDQVTREEAIRFAQLYLNRIIFIFFLTDNGLLQNRLFTEEVRKLLGIGQCTEFSRSISDYILNLFKLMDKGQRIPYYFGYNGGLFKEIIPSKIYFFDIKDPNHFKKILEKSKIKKRPPLDEFTLKAIEQYGGKLNPIILNFLRMDNYDFQSQINVYILGHIFEQSISDLEILKGQKISKRKKEGVYYTPEYITNYICTNTIVPHLSKNGSVTITELVNEYSDNIDELEKKIKEIKIIDPACGSGAFLVKAVETLLEIGKEIQQIKTSSISDPQITQWSEEKEINKIIENNVFGVDKNEESVEITKLSLFLKMTTTEKKLPELSKNIIVGNSVIDDKTIVKNALNWKNQFKEIFDMGGFDIVIGNPPYIKSRDQVISETEKEAIEKKFETPYEMWDIYVPFMELGLKLLKKNGNFGMIVKDTLGEVKYTKKLIDYIEKNYNLYQIDFFPGIKIFEEAAVENKIAFIQNTDKKIQTARLLHHPTMVDISRQEDIEGIRKYSVRIAEISINLDRTIPLGDICYTSYGLRLNSDKGDKKFKFKKKDLLSTQKNSINKRAYTEGKYIEEFSIAKELFVEWDTDRCPARLVRPTFPELYEPEKLMLSRQKRIASYSNEEHVCDNTIIVGILAKDLKNVDNSHVKKYFKNLKTPRGEIEKNSERFELKFILALINSNLIRYFLKYNSGGKIDSYPDDWKKIPIKDIPKSDQKTFVKLADSLIKYGTEFHSKKLRFFERIMAEFKLDKVPKSFDKFYEYSSSSFLNELEKCFKVKLNFRAKDEWQDYFEKYSKELNGLGIKIEKKKKELNDLVYDLYGLDDNEITIIEKD